MNIPSIEAVAFGNALGEGSAFPLSSSLFLACASFSSSRSILQRDGIGMFASPRICPHNQLLTNLLDCFDATTIRGGSTTRIPINDTNTCTCTCTRHMQCGDESAHYISCILSLVCDVTLISLPIASLCRANQKWFKPLMDDPTTFASRVSFLCACASLCLHLVKAANFFFGKWPK